MGLPLSVQLSAFVYSIFTGALLGCLYDCLRILRVLSGISSYTSVGRKLYARSLPLIGSVRRPERSGTRHAVRLIRLTLGDVLFAFLAGCGFSVFLYHAASGCFRWFYLLGCACGFFLYYFTVGKIVMLSSEMLAFLLIAAFRYAIVFLLFPLRLTARIVTALARMLYRRVCVPVFTAVHRRRALRLTRRIRSALPAQIRFSGIS